VISDYEYRIGQIMTKNGNGHGRERKLRGGRLRPDGSREHVYTPELATEICRRVSLGETLTVVCKSLGVDPATVRDWVVGDREGFAQVHARARRSQVGNNGVRERCSLIRQWTPIGFEWHEAFLAAIFGRSSPRHLGAVSGRSHN
jgi:hypothetical protein